MSHILGTIFYYIEYKNRMIMNKFSKQPKDNFWSTNENVYLLYRHFRNSTTDHENKYILKYNQCKIF